MRHQIIPQRLLSEAENQRSIGDVEILMLEFVMEWDWIHGVRKRLSRAERNLSFIIHSHDTLVLAQL
jgi:hypothetical protein